MGLGRLLHQSPSKTLAQQRTRFALEHFDRGGVGRLPLGGRSPFSVSGRGDWRRLDVDRDGVRYESTLLPSDSEADLVLYRDRHDNFAVIV